MEGIYRKSWAGEQLAKERISFRPGRLLFWGEGNGTGFIMQTASFSSGGGGGGLMWPVTSLVLTRKL